MDEIDKMALAQLAQELAEADENEKAWKERRKNLQSDILKYVEVKPEGSSTHDFGTFKVKTTGRINRNVNAAKWDEIKGDIPEELHAIIEYKPKVSTKGFRWVMENNPGLMATLSQAITSKPGSPSVSVEFTDGDK